MIEVLKNISLDVAELLVLVVAALIMWGLIVPTVALIDTLRFLGKWFMILVGANGVG